MLTLTTRGGNGLGLRSVGEVPLYVEDRKLLNFVSSVRPADAADEHLLRPGFSAFMVQRPERTRPVSDKLFGRMQKGKLPCGIDDRKAFRQAGGEDVLG